MKAELEITSGVIRWVVDDSGPFGTPFIASAVLVADEKVAIIKGLQHNDITKGHFDAMRNCLLQHSFEKVRWHRYEMINGVLVPKEVNFELERRR